MTALRIGVVGAGGRMGSLTCATIGAQPDLVLAARVRRGDPWPTEPVDVLVDLGTAETARRSLEWGVARGVPVVVGSTGLDEDWLADFTAAMAPRAPGTCFAIVPNFSVSAALVKRFALEAVRHFPSVEIVEYSHPRKLEAPSGTAMDTARALGDVLGGRPSPDATSHTVVPGARGSLVNGVPVHSVRLAGVMNQQKVLLGTTSERLTLEFDVHDREAFMAGLLLVVRAAPQRRGVVRGLESFLGGQAGWAP